MNNSVKVFCWGGGVLITGSVTGFGKGKDIPKNLIRCN